MIQAVLNLLGRLDLGVGVFQDRDRGGTADQTHYHTGSQQQKRGRKDELLGQGRGLQNV